MNLEQLVELRRLLAKSAPGAVKVGAGFYSREVRDGDGDTFAFCGHPSDELACARAELLAAVINALPELLDLAKRELRAERECCETCRSYMPDSVVPCRDARGLSDANYDDFCSRWRAKDGDK